MLLTRLPLRATFAASPSSPGCLRCLSSGPQKQNSILDILKSSDVARKPVDPKANPSSVMRFAQDAGLNRTTPLQEVVESERRSNFQRQMFRRWRPGDVYSPSDLSGAEQKKWKVGRSRPTMDAFDVLGINPVTEYKNFTMMSEYMTETGRIKHSRDTGLRPKNQRKIAKAIRRAIGLGLMPSVHRHPLVMKKSFGGRFI